MTKVCTFDNPATMRRECWQDGQIVWSCDALALHLKPPPGETQPIPRDRFFFGANIGPWKKGQKVGDPEAIDPREEEHDDHCAWFDGDQGCSCGLFDRIEEWLQKQPERDK